MVTTSRAPAYLPTCHRFHARFLHAPLVFLGVFWVFWRGVLCFFFLLLFFSALEERFFFDLFSAMSQAKPGIPALAIQPSTRPPLAFVVLAISHLAIAPTQEAARSPMAGQAAFRCWPV